MVPVTAETTIDENLAAAERETQDLQRELTRLDQSWNDKLAELDKLREAAAPATPDNIIALGSRVRQQQ